MFDNTNHQTHQDLIKALNKFIIYRNKRNKKRKLNYLKRLAMLVD